ncbi:MAG: FAD-binding oxidoreductase [Nocardioidaceae bacterium]
MEVERRTVLRGGLALGAAAALGACSSSPEDNPSSGKTPTPGPTSPASGAVPWHALRSGIDGSVLLAGQVGYPVAKQLYDPRFDGVRPAAVVRPKHADDVAETIRFARRHDLALVSRSGGHSYVGASTRKHGIQLDLRGLADVEVDGQSVRVGPGARLFDVHSALDAGGRTIPTGTCPTVGAAGLTLGGGVGVESRAMGLTCDAVTRLQVVLADGTAQTVTESSEPDLFWALRGGGGGNFGVVTEFTYQTSTAGQAGLFFLSFADRDAVRMLQGWWKRIAVAPRSSWSNAHLDAQSGGTVSARLVGVSLTGDAHAEANAMVAAIGAEPTSTTITQHSHHDTVKLLGGCSSLSDDQCHLAPQGTLQRERFVAGSDIATGNSLPAAALVQVVRTRGQQGQPGSLILDSLGGAIADGDSAFPWRSARADAQWYVGLGSADATALTSAKAWIASGHKAFGSSSIGAYVNYLEHGRPIADYYGDNFSRLQSIKGQVDPDNFFGGPWAIPLP